MAKAKKTGNLKKKPIGQYDHKGGSQLTIRISVRSWCGRGSHYPAQDRKLFGS
jgi:hypothetical protein